MPRKTTPDRADRAAANAAGKQRGRPFPKGNSGNPAGKARGTRHLATRAADALLDGEVEALTRKAIEIALGGDTVALRLCLERVAPVRKGRPVTIDIPRVEQTSDLGAAFTAVTDAMAAGEITPDEAAIISTVLEARRRSLETIELDKRLQTLEQMIAKAK